MLFVKERRKRLGCGKAQQENRMYFLLDRACRPRTRAFLVSFLEPVHFHKHRSRVDSVAELKATNSNCWFFFASGMNSDGWMDISKVTSESS